MKHSWNRLTTAFRHWYAQTAFTEKSWEAAGMTEVHTPEEFAKLPFSEKKDLRDAYPLGLMAVPEEEIVGSTPLPVPPAHRSSSRILPRM